jgi:hypothetical protein
MKKRGVLIIFVVLILFFLFGDFVFSKIINSNHRAGYINAGIKESERIDSNVLNILDSGQEKIKVIVKLKEGEDFQEIKEEDIKNKIKHKFVYSNSFSAELTRGEIELLQKKENIERIYYDYPIKAFIQNTTGIVNASITWNLKENNLNLTGIGETVCIIDTGINYSHVDLGECLGEGCRVLGGYDFVNDDEDPVDDHGHGTHCAGIVGASGGLKGMATEVNFIAIKVLNASGSGSSSDLDAGIEWCVNNASIFNISVISISLGGGLYTEYCDDDFPSTTAAINAAIAKNISVVVATGNDGYYNAISAPACIENSTRVTSTNKSDNSISSFANTWNDTSFLILAAPGGSSSGTSSCSPTSSPSNWICSTWRDGGYLAASGTSMATPHVSGAIAIMKQYLRLTERTKTPNQIEEVLNNTGKLIYDSYANMNFSRIDVYSSILSLDEYAPIITLISPTNTTRTIEKNITFACNATDLSLKNITFYLWNSTSLVNETSYDTSGGFYELEINVTNLEFGDYYWNCFSCDEVGNCDFSSNNFTLIIHGVLTELIFPEDETYTNQEITNFTCQANSLDNLFNLSLIIWNSSNEILYTETKNISGVENSSFFEINFTTENLIEEDYNWNCLVFNQNSDSSYSSNNFTFTYDITFPLIQDIEISKTYNSATISWITNELTNSSFELVGVENKTNSEYNLEHSYSFTGLGASTTYDYYVISCDLAGNCNYTNNSFTTNSAPITYLGGGGGSSSNPPPATTLSLDETQLSSGYTKELAQENIVNIQIKNQNHKITLKDVSVSYALIRIESNPIEFYLFINEERKIDLDNDDYYDLYLKLNNVTGKNANLTIQSINEYYGVIEEDENEEIVGGEDISLEERNWGLFFKIVLAVIAMVGFIFRWILPSIKFKRNKSLKCKKKKW